MTKKEINELINLTLQDYPLPCKREYKFGPYPECKKCFLERQMLCPLSPFNKGDYIMAEKPSVIDQEDASNVCFDLAKYIEETEPYAVNTITTLKEAGEILLEEGE